MEVTHFSSRPRIQLLIQDLPELSFPLAQRYPGVAAGFWREHDAVEHNLLSAVRAVRCGINTSEGVFLSSVYPSLF